MFLCLIVGSEMLHCCLLMKQLVLYRYLFSSLFFCFFFPSFFPLLFEGIWVLNFINDMSADSCYIRKLRTCCRNHGQASSWFDYVPEAARNCHRTTLWEVWREVCYLRLLCAPMHSCAGLRWVQLWVVSGPVCHLRRCWNFWCLLLQGVYTAGER